MIEKEKYQAFLQFGSVRVDSEDRVSPCELPIGIRVIGRGIEDAHSFNIPITEEMYVGIAIKFAIDEAKKRFWELYPNAQVERFP